MAKVSDLNRVVAAQGISAIGDRVHPVALTFAALSLTHSAKDLGVVLGAESLSLAALILVGGRLADRLPRRRIMVAADLARFGIAVLLAMALLTDAASIWLIAVLAALHGASAAMFYPAASGLIPRVCEPHLLPRANARLSLWRDASYLAGPAIGAVAIGVAGPAFGFVLDGFSFLASAYVVFTVHERSVEDSHSDAQRADALFAFLRSERWLTAGIVSFVVFLAVGVSTWQVTGPVMARADLGGVWGWSLLLGAGGVGSVLGAIVIGRRRRSPALPTALTALYFAWAVQLATLARPLSLAAIGFAAALGGALLTMATVIWNARLQRSVPDALLGRVSSVDWFGSLIAQPLGYVAVGLCVARFGAPQTARLGAVILAVGGLLGTGARVGRRAKPKLR